MTLDDIMKHSTLTLRTQPSPIDAHTNGNQRADELPAVEQIFGEMAQKSVSLQVFVGFFSFHARRILEGHITRTQAKMDEKQAKLPAADDAASPNDGSNKLLSLGHQAFDVFKDVFIGDLAEENRKLRIENEKLAPVNETLNSTLTVVLAGKEYTSDLIFDDDRGGKKVTFRFANTEATPLLDLAGPSPFFDGLFASVTEPSVQAQQAPPTGPRLVVTLGSIEIGALNIESGFRGGRIVSKRVVLDENKDGVPFLLIWLTSRVVVGGRLANISEEDLSDNFRFFNQQASARLLMGAPADIRNGESITFTMEFIRLHMTPELEETVDVLLPYKHASEVSEAPDIVISGLVEEVLEDDGNFSETFQENRLLKYMNLKLLAVRERLGTVDVRYQGGSLRLSLENCHVVKDDDKTLGILSFPSPSDGLITVTFTQLKTIHIALAGFDVCSVGMRIPMFCTDSALVAIPYGPEVKIFGIIDLIGERGGQPEPFHWPGDNAHQAIFDALHGTITLPDEVVFKFVGLQFDCSCLDSRIVRSLKLLGVWPNVEESEDVLGVGSINLDSDDGSS